MALYTVDVDRGPATMNLEMNKLACLVVLLWMLAVPFVFAAADVVFPSGDLTLHGVVYRPEGKGPFPAVVYNHGSAAGMLSKTGFDALGPVFASHGWVFFGPYRRGQGLSASAGPYIGDQSRQPKRTGVCRQPPKPWCGCWRRIT